MGCISWDLQRKMTAIYQEHTVFLKNYLNTVPLLIHVDVETTLIRQLTKLVLMMFPVWRTENAVVTLDCAVEQANYVTAQSNAKHYGGFKSTCVDGHTTLTHWDRDSMTAFSQTTFSHAFSWMKKYEFQLTFHWSLFLRVKLTIFQCWFRLWLGADQATSHNAVN